MRHAHAELADAPVPAHRARAHALLDQFLHLGDSLGRGLPVGPAHDLAAHGVVPDQGGQVQADALLVEAREGESKRRSGSARATVLRNVDGDFGCVLVRGGSNGTNLNPLSGHPCGRNQHP